jgi:cytochrome c553
MRKVVQYTSVFSLGLIVGIALPYTAWSYPAFQRLPYVSDAAPYCAGCHSSKDASYHPELPADAAQAQVYTTKHYKALEEGTGAFRTLEPEQRKQLLEQAKKIDQNASVKLDAPATVAPGGTITVTVTAKGGIGPVTGVLLVDEPLRYQARPVQGTGWFIAGPPEIIGPDGKPQATWLDRRYNKQQTNLNFALIYGVTADSTSRVSYLLRAPQTPGEYPITAAFIYGTGEANEMKTEKYVEPPGGGTAPSGRLLFSNVVRVRVQ